ncbi:MAG: HAD family phosphatase [Patescibacteria group bacterium]
MLRAVIFDLNGVIIDDEKIHQKAWRQFCKKNGLNLTKNDYRQKVFGRTAKDTLKYLYKNQLTEDKLNQLASERIDIAIEMIKTKLKLPGGLKKLLALLNKNKISLAIATSSRARYVDFVTDKTKIRKHFKLIVTAQDVNKGKPYPEIYLKTAGKLKVDPNDCVVFEDSIQGVMAAKKAGMKVIAITTTHTKIELKQADKVIKSFTEVDYLMLKEALSHT